jgi:hypothetical protein
MMEGAGETTSRSPGGTYGTEKDSSKRGGPIEAHLAGILLRPRLRTESKRI